MPVLSFEDGAVGVDDERVGESSEAGDADVGDDLRVGTGFAVARVTL
jgi:hypothetical protein